MTRGFACSAALIGLIGACGGAASPATAARDAGCGRLDAQSCSRARGLLAAASAFSTVRHDYLLDPTSSFASGRAMQLLPGGAWDALPTACARPTTSVSRASVDPRTIDFGFVGVSIDSTLVSADADVSPYFSAGASGGVHTVRLVAVALVRDLDPQFFEASEDVSLEGASCACSRASHFVGAVKLGGMLSYETTVRDADVHATALDFVKAKLSARDAVVTETRVGGLEIDGLDDTLSASGKARPLVFRVANPVPIAYAVHPIADVCRLAFPAPEVAPAVVDFGNAPYGREVTRLVHVVNRAPFDLRASIGSRTVDIGARASADVAVAWAPTGEAAGCDAQERQDAIVFTPKDASAPVVPRSHSVGLSMRVRTGRGVSVRAERVDTGVHRSPDYASTKRVWTCPPEYVVSSCSVQGDSCGDPSGACSSQGYTVTAEASGNGCRFGCEGPKSLVMGSNACRFEAVMACKLACP